MNNESLKKSLIYHPITAAKPAADTGLRQSDRAKSVSHKCTPVGFGRWVTLPVRPKICPG